MLRIGNRKVQMTTQRFDCSSSVSNLLRVKNGKKELIDLGIPKNAELIVEDAEYSFVFYWNGPTPAEPRVGTFTSNMSLKDVLLITAAVFEKAYGVVDPVTKTSVREPVWSACEMVVSHEGKPEGLVSTPFFEVVEINNTDKTVVVTLGI